MIAKIRVINVNVIINPFLIVFFPPIVLYYYKEEGEPSPPR